MTLINANLNWLHWFEKWEAMQNCYIPQRLYRFNLMLKLSNFPRHMKVYILDLGGGPGSLAFRSLEYYPNAHIVVADADRVLLTIGQNIARQKSANIQFLRVDIRQTGWWESYQTTFNLVLSATALHWLNTENLAQVYQRIYQVLKPGGWFMNSDHIASDNPKTQSRYRKILQDHQQMAFNNTEVDNWDGFWQSLAAELGRSDLTDLRETGEIWEGTDDGQPQKFHTNTLQNCGFEQIRLYWRDLGEGIIGARKPL
ncbi:MAG: class I SAM-dependent methyltransferase [Planctomycetota bacterium]|nr:MAG: class I SAM-dependent methyltransferase [Planctomycetota bacterium]